VRIKTDEDQKMIKHQYVLPFTCLLFCLSSFSILLSTTKHL